MRKTRIWIILSTLLLTAAVIAWAQGRKPGLWDLTTTMTWQKSPFPPGMTPPGGPNSPFSGAPRTTPVCLTQAMIDKFGAPVPQNRDCTITNVQKTDHGMSGDMVCTGRMNGKGSMTSTWEDPEHAKGSVHFTGTVDGRNGTVPVEWTSESSSVYKSADCGDVKPLTTTDDK